MDRNRRQTQSANGIAYGSTYLAMFAIPLLAPGEKPSLLLRAAALSGFAMTLLNVVLAVFPIYRRPQTVLGLNLAGALFYWRASNIRKAG